MHLCFSPMVRAGLYSRYFFEQVLTEPSCEGSTTEGAQLILPVASTAPRSPLSNTGSPLLQQAVVAKHVAVVACEDHDRVIGVA